MAQHTCAIDPSRVEAAIAMAQIKERAILAPQETCRHVIAQCTGHLGDEAKTKLAKYNSMQRQIERERKRQNMPYPNPQALADIQIPAPLSITKRGDQFLFHDSGAEDPERFFIFATAENIQTLQMHTVWCIDGTFKVAPQLFYQLWTVHAIVHNAVCPLAYVLMVGKTEALYQRVLAALCQNNQFALTYVISDFEKGAINAIQAQFPNATSHGCFFHLAQSIWRKVQRLGYHDRYVNEDDFREGVKSIAALAFVPPYDVIESFELLQIAYDEDENMQRLLNYFVKVYIGRFRRQRRVIPLFPIEVWNCHTAVVDLLPRTNNNVEGWHRAFQNTLGLVHPNIYLLVAALIKEQSLMETKRARAIAGEVIPRYSKKKNTRQSIYVCKVL